MEAWIMFAVATTTVFFILIVQHKKIKELMKNQEIFLQFFDDFEQEHRSFLVELTEIQKLVRSNKNLIEDLTKLKEEILLQKEQTTNHQASQQNSVNKAEEKQNFKLNEEDPLNLRSRFQDILYMLNNGLSLDEIALRTGKGIGELNLIIELLNRS